MRPPEIGMGMPEQKTSKESLEEIEKMFDEAVDEFEDSEPDFSIIENCIREIKREIKAYQEDFQIILREDEEHGDGLSHKERIKDMQESISMLKSETEKAESIIASEESLFAPYREQIEATKKIILALEKIKI